MWGVYKQWNGIVEYWNGRMKILKVSLFTPKEIPLESALLPYFYPTKVIHQRKKVRVYGSA